MKLEDELIDLDLIVSSLETIYVKLNQVRENLLKLQNCNVKNIYSLQKFSGCQMPINEISPHDHTVYFDFEYALKMLKNGKKVRSKNWDSKYLFIYLERSSMPRFITLQLSNEFKFEFFTPMCDEIVSDCWYIVL